MANLPGPFAMHALKVGAENIPDAAFEKLPKVGKYFREDKDKRDRRHKDEDRSSRNNDRHDSSDSGSDSSSFYSRDNRSRGNPRRRHEQRRPRRDRSRDYSEYSNRGYDSDRGPSGYREAPRYPPPPLVPIINEPGQKQNMPPNNTNQAFIPARYNPQNLGQAPGARDSYFSGHPQEQAPFTPPIPPQQQQQQPPPSQAGTAASDQRSSIADRYRPSNYDARGSSPYSNRSPDRRSHGDDHTALTLRHPSPGGYPQYSPPAYSPYDSEEESRRRRGSSRSKSRGSVRSRSRAASVKVKEEFQKHKKDIGSASIGIVAGGILGSVLAGQVGHGHQKKSSKANLGGMLLGAAIGGISATALERRHEKKKEKRMSYRDGYDSY